MSATLPLSRLHRIAGLLPGAALSAVVALAATFVARWQGVAPMLVALFFGVAFHYLAQDPRHRAGVDFCACQVLRLGVGLLGARITAAQVVDLGAWPIAVVSGAVLSTLALGVLLAPRLGLSRAQGALCGGAVAICGASAALAIASVLPRDRHSARFTLMVVVGVTLLSTLAMVLYPPLARLLDLSPVRAGIFFGATIHDVAQVVGAGYTMGPVAGDTATLVKLFRVALLAAVVAAVGAAFRAENGQVEAAAPRAPLAPAFLWLFAALVALHSMGWLGTAQVRVFEGVSSACLILGIVALGMQTSVMQLAGVGWRPMALLAIATLWMTALVLAAVVQMQ